MICSVAVQEWQTMRKFTLAETYPIGKQKRAVDLAAAR